MKKKTTKKRNTKRIISLVLALVMATATLPISALVTQATAPMYHCSNWTQGSEPCSFSSPMSSDSACYSSCMVHVGGQYAVDHTGLDTCSICGWVHTCRNCLITAQFGYPATCIAEGWTDVYECKNCNSYYISTSADTKYDSWEAARDAAEIPALGHDWSDANGICKRDSDHICDHDGATSGTCAICGKTLIVKTKYNSDITVSWKTGYTPTAGDTVATVKSNLVFSDTDNLEYEYEITDSKFNKLEDTDTLVLGETYYFVAYAFLEDNSETEFSAILNEEGDFVYTSGATILGKSYSENTMVVGDKTEDDFIVDHGYVKNRDLVLLLNEIDGMNIPSFTASAFQPKIIEGADQTVKAGTDASFRSNAEFADFQKILVDGAEIDSANYTVTEGSTIVTLKADYIKTLSVGKHTIDVVSTTGTASTEFTIEAAQEEKKDDEAKKDETTKKDDSTKSPSTGATLGIATLTAGLGLLVVSRKRR